MDLHRIREETWIREIDFHWKIDSTNTRAMSLAESADVTLPTLVLAHQQLRGRGRGTNQWHSSEGSLTFSLIVPTHSLESKRVPQISLTIGLALCQTLEGLFPQADLGLKWPNDVFVADKKIAGVLIEMPSQRPARCVIGVGLNVNNSIDSAVQIPATTLREVSGQTMDPADVLIRCLNEIERGLTAIEQNSSALIDLWRSYDYLLGRRIEVHTYGETHVGVARGIDDFGALLLETSQGIMPCVGGVVRQLG